VVLAAVAVAGALLLRDDPGPTSLTVEWGDGDGHPGCVYDAATRSVDARLTLHGEAPERTTERLTVTAYADENTSRPVGSTSKDVTVEGEVHRVVGLTVPVTRKPHVDEDGVAACRRTLEEQRPPR
jgi:hypothetical protein